MTPAITSRRIRTAESTNQPTTGNLPASSAGVAGRHRLVEPVLISPSFLLVARWTVLTGRDEPRHPASRLGPSIRLSGPAPRGGVPLPLQEEASASMASVSPAHRRSAMSQDFRLALLVAVLLLVGSRVSLEDDFSISVTAVDGGLGAFLPYGLVLVLAG